MNENDIYNFMKQVISAVNFLLFVSNFTQIPKWRKPRTCNENCLILMMFKVRVQREVINRNTPKLCNISHYYDTELDEGNVPTINHGVVPKGRSFTANSTFSILPSSQPSYSYLHTVRLS